MEEGEDEVGEEDRGEEEVREMLCLFCKNSRFSNNFVNMEKLRVIYTKKALNLMFNSHLR